MVVNTRQRGFTLIELLVVIAIIAILAAILFPVYARVKERGRATVCTSNMRQLGNAFRLYVEDYEGYLPFSWNGEYGLAADQKGPLAPYTKNAMLYFCPSDPLGIPHTAGHPTSYGYDWWACRYEYVAGSDPAQYTDDGKGNRMDDIPVQPVPNNPRWKGWANIYILDEWNGFSDDKNGDGIPDSYQWHGKGCHVVLSDTHVKWVNGYDLFGGP